MDHGKTAELKTANVPCRGQLLLFSGLRERTTELCSEGFDEMGCDNRQLLWVNLS